MEPHLTFINLERIFFLLIENHFHPCHQKVSLLRSMQNWCNWKSPELKSPIKTVLNFNLLKHKKVNLYCIPFLCLCSIGLDVRLFKLSRYLKIYFMLWTFHFRTFFMAPQIFCFPKMKHWRLPFKILFCFELSNPILSCATLVEIPALKQHQQKQQQRYSRVLLRIWKKSLFWNKTRKIYLKGFFY